jgi:hypothetical protein
MKIFKMIWKYSSFLPCKGQANTTSKKKYKNTHLDIKAIRNVSSILFISKQNLKNITQKINTQVSPHKSFEGFKNNVLTKN